ncbi:MAG: class I SAM-dependent methyltransferase [Caldilinea sp. CFX5]|nr:class I SAM-dependent methyltransferase [Caldilinea sp. CFX5]
MGLSAVYCPLFYVRYLFVGNSSSKRCDIPSKMWIKQLYAWACERLYAELAGSYNLVSWLVSFGQWDRWRRLALDHLYGGRVLELGFGTGELLPHLATRTMLTVGLDLSPAMHKQASRKLTNIGLSLPLVQAQAQAMPFMDRAFDTIVATFPAPYIFEPSTLAECARILAPPSSVGAGRLVIVGLWVTTTAPAWERLLPLFYGRPAGPVLDRISARLTSAGFVPTLSECTVDLFKVGIIVAERR